MKILLIEPAKAPRSIGGEDVFIYEPLALEYVAAGVSNEHDVRILDMRLDRDLAGALDDFRPDVVGITSYTVHVNVVRKITGQIKERNPEALVVVGGHHATVVPEDFSSPSIDLIVMGEGVFVFREIVRRIERKEELDGIPGVARLLGDNLLHTDPLEEFDLDSIPFPERKLTGKYRKHYYSEWMKPLASIRTSKGCPHKCSFCALWKIARGRYWTRSPEKIVEELASIEEEYVFFADDESLLDVSRMTKLAQLIRESGIRKRYFLYGRSDTIADNPELLDKWKEIGLERVFVGLEFFNSEDLKYIRKSSTLGDNHRAIQILHDLGIDEYASFILRPEFTRTDFHTLRRYCRDLKLRFASFAVLTPLPGTDLYEDEKNRLLTDNYDYFDFVHTLLPTTLPLKEFYKEYYLLYRKAASIKQQLAFMKKYSWREILPTISKAFRLYGRLQRTYQDYAQNPSTD